MRRGCWGTSVVAAFLLISLFVCLRPAAGEALVSLDRSSLAGISSLGGGSLKGGPLTISSEFCETREGGGVIVYSGGVTVRWDRYTLYAETVVFYPESSSFYAGGCVTVDAPGMALCCSSLWADLDHSLAYAENVRLHLGVRSEWITEDILLVFLSQRAAMFGEGEFAAVDNKFSTCTFSPPHWQFDTPDIYVSRSGVAEARKGVVRIGRLPVMYFPRVSVGTGGAGGTPVKVGFGRTSWLGAFVRVQLRAAVTGPATHYALLDYFSRRGWGLGSFHRYSFPSGHSGSFRAWYIRDENDDDYVERRYEFELYHRGVVRFGGPFDSTVLTAEVHRRSDLVVHKDFFRPEWLVEKDPESYVNLQQDWNASSLSLVTKVRLNRYLTETEYLPRLDWHGYGFPLGGGVLRSAAGAGFLRRSPASENGGPEGLRAWSDLTWELPLRWRNKAAFVPAAGVKARAYSGLDGLEHDQNALAFVSLSAATRLVGEPHLSGERGWRHVLLPSIELTATTSPTLDPAELPPFDAVDRLYEERSVAVVLTSVFETKYPTADGHGYRDKFLLRLRNKIYARCDARDELNDGETLGPLNAYFRFRFDKVFVIGDADYDWNDAAFPTAGVRVGWNARPSLSFEWGARYIRRNVYFSGDDTFDTRVGVRWRSAKKWFYAARYSRLFTPGYEHDVENVSLTIARRGHDFTFTFTFGIEDGDGFLYFSFSPNFLYDASTRLRSSDYR